jgi:hypothetical protein
VPSPEEATDEFVARLRVTAACVTDRPLAHTGYRPADVPYVMGFAPRGQPVVLRTEADVRRILFDFSIEYQVIPEVGVRGSFEVRLVGYVFELLDMSNRELFAWHWHPSGNSRVTRPHVHLPSRIAPLELGRGLEPLKLADFHIPSGHVALADVVWFLIAEAGIRPRKRDWEAILAADPATT